MANKQDYKLVLASASAQRLALLRQIGLEPYHLQPVNIDESPRRRETPHSLALRLAKAKAQTARSALKTLAKIEKKANKQSDSLDLDETPLIGNYSKAFVIAGDTVVALGRRIMPKTESVHEAVDCLERLSGRSHRVYTAIAMITPKGNIRSRIVETRVRFKRLMRADIDAYIASGEWRGKAGGYAIQGLASAFVINIKGSYTSVVGLPLYETVCLLQGEGFPVVVNWLTCG